ncbi:acyl-CoA dehydrogenase family protein [Alkalinema sp. FACHB-956]|uniref:acyl-CoA dehydrogenase family protein n=1 Tax=Alkalinema sp. FACHB-956 TaxID=2692768 RepID=UPI001687D4E9|nr:acyl-CoA dehydrogenase family protein [Alkalinema sp. FACHB-956]MBD2325613.1 acyl-CoA/acyl-ACP dehydrogenase [Alkalinema sp. FACHB-956]
MHPLLTRTDQLCQTHIAPQAQTLDWNPDALAQALALLGQHDLLALKAFPSWQGVPIDALVFAQFQERLARSSGALAFLQTQHQSAGGMLANSDNRSLQADYLPKMASGEALVGIAFSHLRRVDNPPVTAIVVDDGQTINGYELNGYIPWITGSGIFQDFILAATLSDGSAVYGLLPFKSTTQSTGGSLLLSEPMQLAAMNAAQTVTGNLNRWILPSERVVTIRPAGAMPASDRANVLSHSSFALGCAQAGLDWLLEMQQRKSFLAIGPIHTDLSAELYTCRTEIDQALTNQNSKHRLTQNYEAQLSLRVWAIDLALRCTQAAVVASSGAANQSSHPANRLYREALVWSVAGQTPDVLAAALQRIAGRSTSMVSP